MTTPCTENRHVYDALIDHHAGHTWRWAVDNARALCATCPIWQACLTANADEEWAQAVITGKNVMHRVAARRAS